MCCCVLRPEGGICVDALQAGCCCRGFMPFGRQAVWQHALSAPTWGCAYVLCLMDQRLPRAAAWALSFFPCRCSVSKGRRRDEPPYISTCHCMPNNNSSGGVVFPSATQPTTQDLLQRGGGLLVQVLYKQHRRHHCMADGTTTASVCTIFHACLWRGAVVSLRLPRLPCFLSSFLRASQKLIYLVYTHTTQTHMQAGIKAELRHDEALIAVHSVV